MKMLILLKLNPIGVIHTPHTDPKGTPIQSIGATDIRGIIELDPEYVDGQRSRWFLTHNTTILVPQGKTLQPQSVTISRDRETRLVLDKVSFSS